MSRGFLVAAIAATAVAGTAGAVVAQDAGPRTFGGGGPIKVTKDGPWGGSTLVSAALSADGSRASILGHVWVVCRDGMYRGDVTHVGNVVDGKITGRGTSAITWDATGKLRLRYIVDATVGPNGLDGTLAVSGRRGGKSCRSAAPSSAFAVRPLVAHSGTGKPLPSTHYRGSVSRDYERDVVAPFLLQTSADGQRVAAAKWLAVGRCKRAGKDPYVNISPSAPVRLDGTFTINERFSERFSDARLDYRVSFVGRFTEQGVAGTLRVRQTLKMKNKRRKGDSCDTGTLRWSGTP